MTIEIIQQAFGLRGSLTLKNQHETEKYRNSCRHEVDGLTFENSNSGKSASRKLKGKCLIYRIIVLENGTVGN